MVVRVRKIHTNDSGSRPMCLAALLVCSACSTTGAPKSETTDASEGDDGRPPVGSGFIPSFDEGNADDESTETRGDDGETGAETDATDSGDEGQSQGATGSDTGNQNCNNDALAFSLADEHNYSFQVEFTLEHEILAARSNFTVDWSQLERDLRGRPIEAGGPLMLIELTLWRLSLEELEIRLNEGTLTQKDLEAIVTAEPEPGQQHIELFDFTSFGAELDPEDLLDYMDPETFNPATHSYMLSLNASDNVGERIRMLQVFSLDEEAEQLELTITDKSASADIEVDLEHGRAFGVPMGPSPFEIDYTQLSQVGNGDPLDIEQLGHVRIARFEHSLSELSANVLELEELAAEFWNLSVEDGKFKPAMAKNENGNDFPGIDNDNTWLMSLEYSGGVPLPPVLTRLVPCR